MVGTFDQPDFQTDTGTAYKTAIDNSIAVVGALAGQFAAHEQSSPNMTVRVDAGKLLSGTTLTNVAAQNTGTITAPVTNPRIDRVVIDASTGAVSVITGTEAVSPTAPAITSGKIPIAQVALATSTTAITNSLITDERPVSFVGEVTLNGVQVFTNKTFSDSVGIGTGTSSSNKLHVIQATGGGNIAVFRDSTNTADITILSPASNVMQIETGSGDTLRIKSTDAITTYVANSTQAAEVRLREDTDNGTNYIGIKAPDSITTSKTWVLPETDVTNGYFKSDGSGNITLSTISSSLTYLSTQTASSSSSLDFTSLITSSYDVYVFYLIDIKPATDDVALKLRTSTNNGSSYDSTSYAYALRKSEFNSSPAGADSGSGSTDAIYLLPAAGGIGNAAAEGLSGVVTLINPLGTTIKKAVNFETVYLDGSATPFMAKGAGYTNATADVDAVRFLMDSGNITSGKIIMYGYKNS